jgi:tyrosine-protein phosphatase SIW14
MINSRLIKKILFAFLLTCSIASADPRVRPTLWAQPVLETGLSNIYQVDSGLYRSEQPERESLQQLAKVGIQEILNLRGYHSDKEAAENLPFVLHSVEMDAATVTPEQLITALRVIKQKKGSLLVHCWHGSDRTGTVIAAYRIIFQNWPKKQAIDEMVNGGYGYHGSVYPNLVDLLENLDVATVKAAVEK